MRSASPPSWARALLPLVVVGAAGWLSSSCAPSGFASESLVQSVRILASASVDTTLADPMADPSPSYAQPGDTVSLQVLAYDGRTTQTEPMKIYWLPFVCENPPDDAYYACFAQAGAAADGGAPQGGDAGASSGGLAALKPGVDLTPFLPSGPSYQFQMPSDVVATHTPVPGSAAPYGLTILFNAACAGHLELLPTDPGNINPQQIPLGCFDTNENQVGPDDWVFGFTRVYAFAPQALDGGPLLNANPLITSLDINGQTQPVTLVPNTTQIYAAQGFQTPRCTASSTSKCAHIPIGPNVPATSWEPDPGSTDVHGNPLHEEIWEDFYSTFGSFSGNAGLLYDATTGSLGGPSTTDAQFEPPTDAGDGFIWIVVHDNRGGAAWVTVPVQVQ